MRNLAGKDRHFLFLQGPHGPFFQRLATMLRKTGATVWRAGFNAGDQAFWGHRASYLPFTDSPKDWPEHLNCVLTDKGITDIVLYGDTRPIHAQAVAAAKARNITVHVFEEGYLRPYWVTYERGGSNGHSCLMQMDVAHMRSVLARSEAEIPEAPGHWGDMREHIFYGALYHWFVMFSNRRYRNFRPHRSIPVSGEFRLYVKRLALMPWLWFDRIVATHRIKSGGFPYHLVLLQLEHDASFQHHSPFTTMTDFIAAVIDGFARGAPSHHHLVFKAHPLEDGRVPLRAAIRQQATASGIADRVHFVRGGKLAQLLDHARGAVTVNSTAAQQVLWRGLPLKAFGAAVYAKPEFVSDQPLSDFFARPRRPDPAAYRDYRLFLLETSQVAGGFYSTRGRRQLLRQIVDMMLAPADPYDALEMGTAAPRQQLSLVK